MTKINKQRSEYWGRLAEIWVGVLMNLKGYRGLARRYRSPFGDIDLIVKCGKNYRFIEVKYRRKFSIDQLDQTLPSPKAQQRIARTANDFMKFIPSLTPYNVYFDCVIISRFGKVMWFDGRSVQ